MLSRRVNKQTLELIENSESIILSIAERVEGNSVVFTLCGALRNDLVYEFDDELSAAVSVGKNLVLDMAELTYIAGASLKVLLRIQQKLDSMPGGVEMKLINVGGEIMKVFSESGLNEILDIEEKA